MDLFVAFIILVIVCWYEKEKFIRLAHLGWCFFRKVRGVIIKGSNQANLYPKKYKDKRNRDANGKGDKIIRQSHYAGLN